jgi:hypothetical protein
MPGDEIDLSEAKASALFELIEEEPKPEPKAADPVAPKKRGRPRGHP